MSVVLCQVQWPLTQSIASHSSIRHHHGSRINPETLPSCCPITTMSRTAITLRLYCAQWRHFLVLKRSMRPSCALQPSGKLKNLYKTYKYVYVPSFGFESYSRRCLCLFIRLVLNLLKATVSFISVCPSVRLYVRMEQLDSHLTDFYEIWYLKIFRKSVERKVKFD